MSITPQWKDELRARITLSTVVQRTTKITKKGREWAGCCPFHDEKTPSFYVNDQKQFYHCFGCGAHGDVITWMIEQRGLGFMDAIKELALEAGMEVPAPDPIAAKKAEKRAELVDVTTAAQNWFVDNLRSNEGREALDYLKGRGLSRDVLREFGFGYAPENKQALATALARFEPEMLADSGMRIVADDGSTYDRFRGRVMLPIQDARGRVIAFGGRILAKREGLAKYLNSPDTPLFDKGRTLYNLHRAAPASRQSGRVIVVEGYLDVVALHQAGFTDAVAPLGTALTETQLEMLWRMVEVPTLCFDGDAAGQRAAMRAISRALPMLAPMRSLNIVRLPSGLDPDDLIKQQGTKAMEGLLANPQNLLDAIWTAERDAQRLDTPESKAGLKARLLEHVDAIQDGDIRALYRRDLLDRFSAFAYPARENRSGSQNGRWTRQRLAPTRLSNEAKSVLQRIVGGSQRNSLLDAVLAGFVCHPDQIERHTSLLIQLAQIDPQTTTAIESLIELSETLDSDREMAISVLQGQIAPADTHPYAFLREGTPPADARDQLAEAVSLLVQKPALETAMAATVAKFDEDPEGAFAEQDRLRIQLNSVNQRLKEFGRREASVSREGSKAANTAAMELKSEEADRSALDQTMD